jgi:hypothetical protein
LRRLADGISLVAKRCLFFVKCAGRQACVPLSVAKMHKSPIFTQRNLVTFGNFCNFALAFGNRIALTEASG